MVLFLLHPQILEEVSDLKRQSLENPFLETRSLRFRAAVRAGNLNLGVDMGLVHGDANAMPLIVTGIVWCRGALRRTGDLVWIDDPFERS